MNQSDRIALIANAVAQSDNKVNKKFANLLEELKAEKLAEDLVLEHGIQHASDDDVKEEFVSLDAVEREEDEDFDNDENLVDMGNVSSSLREIFES